MSSTPADAIDLGGRSYDHYARLVRRFLGVPVGLVTLVESQRQVFPGAVGLEEPWQSERETPLSHSFCQYVVRDGRPLVVPDAREDTRLADSPAIADLGVIAYAGWPLIDAAGGVLGSLCAIDTSPREWTGAELAGLEDLAQACSAELQHAVAQAEASHQLVRRIVAAADVAMAFYDDRQRLLLANGRATEIAAAAGFQLDRPPYAGRDVRYADRRSPVPDEDQIIPRALRGEPARHEIEWVGPPGQEVAVVASAQRLLRPDGDPWGTLVVMHDVTELAMALEMRERVSATVSHELRTPLTAILGYLELLSEDVDPANPAHAAMAQGLARIRRSAETLVGRLAQVLDTSQRRRHLGLRATDVGALVERVLESFAQAATSGMITVDVDGQQWANVDAARVEQAVENLVGNAVKYSDPGGRVEVRVRGTDTVVVVVVVDHGVGMTAAEVDRSFEPYWRADSARESTAQGLGLGLPLVHDIAVEHRGSVDIASTPGEGTTVTLTLPRVPI